MGADGGKAKIPLKTKVAIAFNDVVHMPIIEDVAYYVFWMTQLCFAPLYALIFTMLFLRDLFNGVFVPKYEGPKGRAIVITGCDTGFGHDLALTLYEKGWKVYAGCLTTSGAKELMEKAGGPDLVALKMNVTEKDDIVATVERIRKEVPEGLFAIVNNAGVGRGGIVDWMSIEEYRSIMEVNFFSMVMMVKAFLPLLKESRGRIINITSFAGLFLGAPCMSAYSASKHAAEAFTTSLRFEMQGWGIKVVTVNPSFHKTLIASRGPETIQRSYDMLNSEQQEEYGPPYLKACRSISRRAEKSSWDPKNVVNALVRATTSVNPRTQYVVGADAKFGMLPLLCLPTHLVEQLVSFVLLGRLIPARIKKEKSEGSLTITAAAATITTTFTTAAVTVAATATLTTTTAAATTTTMLEGANNTPTTATTTSAVLEKANTSKGSQPKIEVEEALLVDKKISAVHVKEARQP